MVRKATQHQQLWCVLLADQPLTLTNFMMPPMKGTPSSTGGAFPGILLLMTRSSKMAINIRQAEAAISRGMGRAVPSPIVSILAVKRATHSQDIRMCFINVLVSVKRQNALLGLPCLDLQLTVVLCCGGPYSQAELQQKYSMKTMMLPRQALPISQPVFAESLRVPQCKRRRAFTPIATSQQKSSDSMPSGKRVLVPIGKTHCGGGTLHQGLCWCAWCP